MTRDRICEAALETIDASGLESVSMRNLAGALGVKASSLYYHFDSKDELLTGVAEFLYRRLGRPPSKGEWTEQVKGTFVQFRDFIQTHPNAAPLLVRDLAYSPVAKKRANVLLRMVSRAGLDGNRSACLISNMVALLVGHTFLDVWLREGSGSSTLEAEATDGQGERGSAADPDGSRPWVHRLFSAEALGPDEKRGRVLTSETVRESSSAIAKSRPSSGRKSGPRTSTDSTSEDQGNSYAAFLAGLDALIRGFAPD